MSSSCLRSFSRYDSFPTSKFCGEASRISGLKRSIRNFTIGSSDCYVTCHHDLVRSQRKQKNSKKVENRKQSPKKSLPLPSLHLDLISSSSLALGSRSLVKPSSRLFRKFSNSSMTSVGWSNHLSIRRIFVRSS